jgi:peptidoglycan/xylan/chitin deacetylase (PgdA/CDA1 family)
MRSNRGWMLLAVLAVLVLLAYHTGEVLGLSAARPANVVTQVPIAEKAVALTFDDGPTPRWTPQVLALLTQEHVPATFFVIGQQVARYPNLVADEVKAGMEVGNHGFQHRLLRRLDARAVAAEVQQAADLIEGAGAPAPRLYRLPAGVYDRTALEVLGQLGYTVIGWSVDPRDWRHRYTAQQMEQMVLRQVGPGAIIIFHDGTNSSQATLDAVRAIIPALRQQGYRFVTVSQLLSLVKGRL